MKIGFDNDKYLSMQSEHIRERHDGELADNGRNDETVEKKSDSADAEPPKSRRADLLSECAHAERGRAADDGAHKRERAEGRACGAARREKAGERAVLRVPPDSEPEKEREVADDEKR